MNRYCSRARTSALPMSSPPKQYLKRAYRKVNTQMRKCKLFVHFVVVCGISLSIGSCSFGHDVPRVTSDSSTNNASPNIVDTTPNPRQNVFDAFNLCQEAFADKEIISWSDTTVGELRSWSHGGPTPVLPFKDSFPNHDNKEPAAWCLVRQDHNQSLWFAVIDKSSKEVAIVIDTPTGENFENGKLVGPPVAP